MKKKKCCANLVKSRGLDFLLYIKDNCLLFKTLINTDLRGFIYVKHC